MTRRSGSTCGSGARESAAGTCDWALGIGSSGEDEAHAMLVEPSGDVVLTGFFTGTVDFDPGPGAAVLISRGGRDGFVARYGADGTFKNVVQFGGADDDAGNAIARTIEGDLIVPASSRVQALSRFPHPLDQCRLNRHMDVFVGLVEFELAIGDIALYFQKAAFDFCQFAFGNQFSLRKHPGVSD